MSENRMIFAIAASALLLELTFQVAYVAAREADRSCKRAPTKTSFCKRSFRSVLADPAVALSVHRIPHQKGRHRQLT